MTKVKGKDFEPLGGRVPKDLVDRLKEHANQLERTYTDVFVLALQRYMASPESRLAVVEAKLQRAESALTSLQSQVGPRVNYKKAIEDRLAELEARVSPT